MASLTTLPIDSFIPEIARLLKQKPNLVLTAEPGAGKSTRVPPGLLQTSLLSPQANKIIVLQPRRISVRSTAERVASENNWVLSEEVGYSVRFEKRTSAQTQIEFMTEAILNLRLLRDADLSGVGAVILDEFHERNLHLDLALQLLKEVQSTLRPDLKIIVMSATLDSEPLEAYLNANVLKVPGRTYPVELIYQKTSMHLKIDQAFYDQALQVLRQACSSLSVGDILFFLPGVGEIQKLKSRLEEDAFFSHYSILPLHGQLTLNEQAQVLNLSETPKIILATNIAETSLTLPNVKIVIDSGVEKRLQWSADLGVEKLKLQRISKASAEQRKGRAGRTQEGVCYRLWNKMDESSMLESIPAEIKRLDVTPLSLILAAWGVRDFNQFDWFEKPPERHLQYAIDHLKHWNLVHKESGAITPLGERLVNFPMHPRLGVFLLQLAEQKAADQAMGIMIASILSQTESLRFRRDVNLDGLGDCDLTIRLEALSAKTSHYFDSHRLVKARQHSEELFERLPRELAWSINKNLIPKKISDAVVCMLIRSYSDRLVRRRETRSRRGLMVGGKGVVQDINSVCLSSEYYLALELQDVAGKQGELSARWAMPVTEQQIEQALNTQIQKQINLFLDDKGQIRKVEESNFAGLVIGPSRHLTVSDADQSEFLLNLVQKNPWDFFKLSEHFNEWFKKVEYLRVRKPELSWLHWNEDALLTIVDHWCYGETQLNRLKQKSPVPFFESSWSREQKFQFQALMPDVLVVPSGSAIKIQYLESGPRISVRLQEVFGWQVSPQISGEPVTLELLGPHFRPLQITRDLKSFWQTTYFEIRKELRTLYPKHSWPEDPLAAKAEAKGSRRR